jgi:hypothetical protein
VSYASRNDERKNTNAESHSYDSVRVDSTAPWAAQQAHSFEVRRSLPCVRVGSSGSSAIGNRS